MRGASAALAFAGSGAVAVRTGVTNPVGRRPKSCRSGPPFLRVAAVARLLVTVPGNGGEGREQGRLQGGSEVRPRAVAKQGVTHCVRENEPSSLAPKDYQVAPEPRSETDGSFKRTPSRPFQAGVNAPVRPLGFVPRSTRTALDRCDTCPRARPEGPALGLDSRSLPSGVTRGCAWW